MEDESIVRANVGAMAGTAWNVHIYPPLHLINLLPLALKITNPVLIFDKISFMVQIGVEI